MFGKEHLYQGMAMIIFGILPSPTLQGVANGSIKL
jgi:hypothetical protein